MPRSSPTFAVFASLLASTAACAPDPGAWAGTVRDSAGVTIVRNPPAPARPLWIAEADLRVGGDPAAPETLFGHVADLGVDAEGAIYVLDQQAGHVAVLAPDGGVRRVIGAPGDGPGELSGFAGSVVLRGDTLHVADWGRGIVHRFHRDGRFIEGVRIPFAPGARSWWSGAVDGGFLVRVLERYTDDTGRWLGRDLLLRLSSVDAAPDTVLAFSHAPSDLGTRTEPRAPLIVNTPMWTELADGRIAWKALEGDALRIVDRSGELRRLVRGADWGGPAPTAGDRATLTETFRRRIESLGGDGAVVDRLDLVWPERWPGITALAAGPEGTLWLQRWGAAELVDPSALNTPNPPSGFGGGRWEVLDGEGRILGRVDLPEGLRLLRVTGAAAYGVVPGPFDEEIVVRLRLRDP